jgi:hypothetical protein
MMLLCTDNISSVTVGAEIPTEASVRVGYFIMPHAALGNYSHLADILSVVCDTTDPHAIPKQVLHDVRYTASSFNFQYSILS